MVNDLNKLGTGIGRLLVTINCLSMYTVLDSRSTSQSNQTTARVEKGIDADRYFNLYRRLQDCIAVY